MAKRSLPKAAVVKTEPSKTEVNDYDNIFNSEN